MHSAQSLGAELGQPSVCAGSMSAFEMGRLYQCTVSKRGRFGAVDAWRAAECADSRRVLTT
jgi:hypothetical protein